MKTAAVCSRVGGAACGGRHRRRAADRLDVDRYVSGVAEVGAVVGLEGELVLPEEAGVRRVDDVRRLARERAVVGRIGDVERERVLVHVGAAEGDVLRHVLLGRHGLGIRLWVLVGVGECGTGPERVIREQRTAGRRCGPVEDAVLRRAVALRRRQERRQLAVHARGPGDRPRERDLSALRAHQRDATRMRVGLRRAGVLVEEERAAGADLAHGLAALRLGHAGARGGRLREPEHDHGVAARLGAERRERLLRRLLAGYRGGGRGGCQQERGRECEDERDDDFTRRQASPWRASQGHMHSPNRFGVATQPLILSGES